MSLKHHINRGVWALGDKSLPMSYGVVFALVVAQTMSREKFGSWVIFQLIWMATTQLGDNFILQPMVKVAAEDRSRGREVIGASTVMYFAFLIAFALPMWLGASLIGEAFRAPDLAVMMPWMTVMLLCNGMRNIVIRTLQIDYSIERILLHDLVYFIVVIGIIMMYVVRGEMTEPMRMVEANVWGASVSSVFGTILAWKTLSLRIRSAAAYARVYAIGIHQAGPGFLQIIQQQLDGVLLGLFRSKEDVAVYVIAKTYFRGFEAIRDAASLIILPAASELHGKGDRENLLRLTEAATLVLVMVIFPIVLLSELGGNWIFAVIYHGKQDAAIPLFQIFNLGALALPFTIVASNVLLGTGKAQLLYRLTAINAIVFGVSFIVLTTLYGAVGACAALTLTSFGYAFSTVRGMQMSVPLSFSGMRNHAGELGSVIRKFLRIR